MRSIADFSKSSEKMEVFILKRRKLEVVQAKRNTS